MIKVGMPLSLARETEHVRLILALSSPMLRISFQLSSHHYPVYLCIYIKLYKLQVLLAA